MTYNLKKIKYFANKPLDVKYRNKYFHCCGRNFISELERLFLFLLMFVLSEIHSDRKFEGGKL